MILRKDDSKMEIYNHFISKIQVRITCTKGSHICWCFTNLKSIWAAKWSKILPPVFPTYRIYISGWASSERGRDADTGRHAFVYTSFKPFYKRLRWRRSSVHCQMPHPLNEVDLRPLYKISSHTLGAKPHTLIWSQGVHARFSLKRAWWTIFFIT